MATRKNQADFESTLMDALKKKSIAESISKMILETIASSLKEKFDYYDSKITELEKEVSCLKSKLNDTVNIQDNVDHKKVEQKVDNIQQHIRNNNLRIMSVPEAAGENLTEKVYDIFTNKMKVEINKSEIIAAYRVGRKLDDKPRQILVTFQDNAIKMLTYNRKRSLKGSNIVIKEDLTVLRLNIMNAASEKYGYRNVWSTNGAIFAKTGNGVEKLSLEH
nr:unnamed protein product [Callosobruchus chinensis]CAH7755167.1 unnamed protein product [Callosobruchus chinensis]